MKLLLTLLFVTGFLLAEDRPSENDIFAAPKSGEKRKDAFETGEVKDNALQTGGRYYQRALTSFKKETRAGDNAFSLPLQFDGFMDVRPNDRVRGFVDGRLFYDPTRDANSRTTNGTGGSFQFSSTTATPSIGSSSTTTPNPQLVLDQAWLKFDIDRTIFVTAGKQHVKWGTARFWNPTDFLHTQRRDPLTTSDLRLGNMMAKFEMPLEKQKMNLYAIALFDNPQPASSLSQIGGAFRVEKVFGNTELGLEAIVRGGLPPVYGGDFSFPLGGLDFYTEFAYHPSAKGPFYRANSSLTPGANISTLVSTETRSNHLFQVSSGVNYQFGWKDNRLATIGVEYFYNGLGYSDATTYPALIFFGQFQPFYIAKHYAAFYIVAEGPDEMKRTNYTFSTIGNLSDMSFVSRLDFTWRVLTYLTFEAFVAGHYGNVGGEFNFALNTPALVYQGSPVAAVNLKPTFVDVGLGLRLAF